MQYGLIGGKLGHSYSSEVHAMIGGYDYVLKEIPREGLDAFMKGKDFLGINVTIPYKQDVIPYLDEMDDAAREIGAVNTIVNRGGRLAGYNTDFTGLRSLILHNNIDLEGRKVLILGSGGTSRTATAVAKDLGARQIIVAGRSSRPGTVSYEEARTVHADAQVIINATPCGMYPDNLSSAISLEPFAGLEAVVDVIYNPIRTRLVQEAQERGIRACGGLYMLVCQAVAASALFRDTETDMSAADAIYNRILGKKRNVVLTGMPGSGKTTVGRLLAGKLGMDFADTDALIEQMTGRHPSQIIREDGESAFREIEAQAVRTAGAFGNTVISTGGGAVLRKDNVTYLKGNGRVFFLDRSLDGIAPSEDRPLSDSFEKLAAVHRDRYPVYCATCDCRVAVGEDDAEKVAARIAEAMDNEA